MNLRFYLFVSGVNERNGGRGGEFKISLPYPGSLGAFSQFYRERGGRIYCLWSDCRFKANGVWLLFYWKLMPLWVMGVGFGNTCTVTVSVAELCVPSRVWLCPWFLNQGNPILNSMGSQFSILAL